MSNIQTSSTWFAKRYDRFSHLGILLVLAFVLNVCWEEAHHVLYVSYRGGEITHGILLRAGLVDAFVIGVLFGPLLFLRTHKTRVWLSVAGALIFAVALERYALFSGRWIYQSSMPILPWVHTGLTPTIQLALLGWVAFWITQKIVIRSHHRAEGV